MAKKQRLRSSSRALALEQRLLFDGAGAVAADQFGASDHHFEAPKTEAASFTDTRSSETMEAPAGSGNVLVVIDARVADAQGLIGSLPSNASVRVVDTNESGIAAIGAELAKGQFDTVHIISHGTPGEFELGSDKINNTTLNDQSSSVANWSEHLTADADILLYGCDVAQGESGQAFINQLAQITDADVAASVDPTGAESRGGNWVLEAATGAIEAKALDIGSYDALLAATNITDANAATPRTTPEDTSIAISGISITDADNPANMTVRVQTTGGVSDIVLSGTTISLGTNHSSDFTITGSLANINATLASLTFTNELNKNSSTSGYTAKIDLTATDVSNGGSNTLSINNLVVTAVNDAPDLSTKAPLVLSEGGNASFTLQQLAIDGNALDADIATGQQVIGQQMVVITSLPTQGTLTYLGGAAAIGQVIPVSSLGSLKYTHNGTDLTANSSDSFNVIVSDGGGGQTAGSIDITITPANKAPTITGDASIIEGQVKAVAPTITLGDTFDTLGNSTIVIDNVVTGGQGTLFFDTNGNNQVDAGEAISSSRTLTAAEAVNIGTLLKFTQNGAEPNAPAAITPSYRISVQDAGGGAGIGSALTTVKTVSIFVDPNNDDPLLSNTHSSSGSALGVTEGTAPVITTGMLNITDSDRNPIDVSQLTPSEQLVYTLESTPQYGEVQLFIGGTAGWGTTDGTGSGPYAGADGWITLGVGGRFTQADIDAGRIRFVQTNNIASGVTQADSFQFTVRDSAFGYDVWNDPAGNPPTAGREGGVRNNPTDAAPSLQTFHLSILGNNDPHSVYEGGPRPEWPGYGGSSLEYDFNAIVPLPGNISGGSAGAWQEANVVLPSPDGNVITQNMLHYEITRNAKDSGGNIIASIVLPASETVYTLTGQPPNGTVERQLSDGSWETISTNSQFTQQEINDGSIRFVHDGGEDHLATFTYRVSDGTNNHFDGSFSIDIAPTNDRPTANSSAPAQVLEGNGNTVRLGTSQLGMADVDLSQDPTKQTGEGAADFLWFQVTAQPVDGGSAAHGTLERWNGTAWVAVTPGEWLPSSLLTATADGGTSGLRYVHDGSEPLTYTGSPQVTFSYTVRDDLANPGNAFSTDSSAPALADGSAQSNVSAPATVTINITPVNEAPIVANKPSDADPTISGTVTGGGALTGANVVLANIPEGSSSVITSAYLTAVDRDNTTLQRQYRVTEAPAHGKLLLNGTALGVGSTFTQKDIDDGKLSYQHSGTELPTTTVDSLGTYNDKFNFVVNDGVLEDSGDATHHNAFLITLVPTNDKPTVTGPTGPINIDSATGANNPVPGFSVDDPDLAAPGATDFVQVTVRLQDSSGTPLTNYTGIDFGYDTSSGVVVTMDGNDKILQFQGTKAQVNTALAGLTATFASDQDNTYKLEVIVDDRMRDGSGALNTTGDDANGGELNQSTTPGGAPTAVDATAYDWSTNTIVPAVSGNISATTVDIRASSVNDAPIFTAPGSFTVNEDVRSRIGDGTVNKFTVEDAESTAFNTPVTVTITVPSGRLYIGASGTPTSVTPTGGQAVTVGGQGTGTLTLTGRADDIEAVLNARNYADTANHTATGLHYLTASNVNHDTNGAAAGDVTLTLRINEGASAIGGDVGSGSVANPDIVVNTALTITAINDAPAVSATAPTVAIADNTATAVTGFAVSDVDSTDGYATGETDGVIQVTVRLLNGNLAGSPPLGAAQYASVGGLGIKFDSSVSSSGVTVDTTLNGQYGALELRGTRDQINAYLSGLTVQFENINDANVDANYRVEVIADDRLRAAATGDFTNPVTPEANGGANNQQAGLPAVPNTDSFDAYSTRVSTYNVFNVTTNSRLLFVSTVNDPGDITASDVTVNEGSATLTLDASNANISIADPDDNGSTTMSTTVTISKGTITGVGGAGGAVTGTGTNTITITGATEAQINSRLQALTVTYPDPAGAATAADWNGSFTVTVTYNDTGSTGTRPGALAGDTNDTAANPGDYSYFDGVSNALVTTRTFTVTVDGVNDAPIRTAATTTLPAGTEDTNGGAGDTVSTLFGGNFSDPLDNVGGDGTTANGMAGIAITTNNAIPAQGKWQYSTDNGTTWIDVPAVSANNALLLDTNDRLRFAPAADFHGTPGSLVARLVDDSNGAVTSGSTANVSGGNSGGSTPYSDASNAVTLSTTVANVNDRPTAVDTTLTNTNEDNSNPTGATISSLGFGYGDTVDNQSGITGGGNATTSFGGLAIVGNTADSTTEGVWQYNTGGGWVTIGSNGSAPTDSTALILPTSAQLRFVPVADYNGSPGSLAVRVADTAQGFASGSDISATLGDQSSTWSVVRNLDTTVDPRNDAPSFSHTATNPTVTENGTTGGPISIPATKLLSSGTVADIDLSTTPALNSTTFGSGTITVSLSDGLAGDVLQLDSTVTAGVASTSYNASTHTLTITLNSTATVSEVSNILAGIEYLSTSDDPTNLLSGTAQTDRHYTVTLSDGNNTQAGGNAGGPLPLTDTTSGTITLVAANDPPVAQNNVNQVTENDVPNTTSGNVITDNDAVDGLDSDPDTVIADLKLTQIVGNTTETIAAGSTSSSGGTTVQGKYGTLTIGADGSYEYALDNSNPAVNALATGDTLTDEVFTYTLSDGGSTDTATLTITINGFTDGTPQIIPVDGNAAATGDATVYEKGLTSVPDSSETTAGQITVSAPDGIDTITIGGTTFTIADLTGFSTTTPSAAIDTGEGNLYITGITGVVGDPSAPTALKVEYSYTLKTAQNQPGAVDSTDSIALGIHDKKGVDATGTLRVQIVDDVPVATGDAGGVKASETVTVNAGNGVLTNDASGADGWLMSGGSTAAVVGVEAGTGGTPVVGVGTPITGTYGTLTLAADGSYTYVADPAAPGAPPTTTDTFTYTVSDADGDTTTTTLTITIQNNQPPVANDDTRTTPEDTPINGNIVNGHSGDIADSDPDFDPLSVTQVVINGVTTPIPTDGSSVSITIPGNGVLVIDKTGAYTFTPEPDWHGTVPDITYTIDDGKGASNSTDTAILRITVTPVVDIADNTTSTPAGTPVTTPVLNNDSFEGTNPVVTVAPGDGPAHGTVVVNPNGTITYIPAPGYSGQDSYTYTVTSGGVTETATVTITIHPELIPPPAPPAVNPPPSMGMPNIDPRFNSGSAFEAHRMPLPFEPIVYVNPAVVASQELRALNDPRNFSDPSAVQAYGLKRLGLNSDLGRDPSLFVTLAVRDSQKTADQLASAVAGRHSRLGLGSDGYLTQPGLFRNRDVEQSTLKEQANKVKPSAEKAERATDKQPADNAPANPAEKPVEKPANQQAAASQPSSFGHQLRAGAARLPTMLRHT